ncbi:MAG: Hpt domain-containing protein [Desulfofustis sp.]|nr:Hpt domain-containing protein [Desulfofustis sp.]
MADHFRQDRIKSYLLNQFNLPAEQIDGMIPGFISSLAGHLAKLEDVFNSGDLEQVGKAGHTIKGALLNLGLHDCADLAYEIEKKGKKMQGDSELERLFTTLRDKLLPYLN